VSPILVRPVREQLEHDRVIRLLQSRFRRRFEVGINPGHEHNAVVGTGQAAAYPDVVLTSTERGRRLQGVIEVETAESVNNLEAMAQWARMARLRVPFHLYVPAVAVDAARRLCTDNHIPVAEVVSYHSIGDQLRFTTVYRAPTDGRRPGSSRTGRARPRPAARVKAAPRAQAARASRRGKGTAKKKPARPARPAKRK
jgi:hypothetical protein